MKFKNQLQEKPEEKIISFNVRQNITFNEFVQSHYRHFIHPLEVLQRYRKVYKNFFHVFLENRRKKYPINAVLKNGSKVEFTKQYQAESASLGFDKYLHFQDDILRFKKEDLPEVKFFGWEENGDLFAVFYKGEYDFLPVKNKTVIDIGANIGDSSIYFALKGAKKVLGLEPSPINYNFAKKNVEINNLQNKISLINGGINDKKGMIKINQEKRGTLYTTEHNDDNGINVPLMTLEDILKVTDDNRCILKMDCEGLEYKSILSTSQKNLQKFSYMQIEYHFGYKNLKNKLEKCGFKVSISKPFLGKKSLSNNLNSYVGFLYAEQKILK